MGLMEEQTDVRNASVSSRGRHLDHVALAPPGPCGTQPTLTLTYTQSVYAS